MRTAKVTRTTKETDISLSLSLDGTGKAQISTGVGFFDHMLELLTVHSRMDITLTCKGDLQVDAHHTVEDVGIAVPFYIAADAAPIRALIDTYNEVTGENAEPFTMGGGTYARHFPLAVSFGPERQDLQLPEFAGPMHGANEGAKIKHLMQALKIYILALVRLQEIDL